MPILDILKLIPESVQREIVDALVDLISAQAEKVLGNQVSGVIKKLRSDAAFAQAFQEGLRRAADRFVREYEVEDEDLVAAIAADHGLFKNKQVQEALLAIIKKPGVYLADEQKTVLQSFGTVLPERKNRQRVDRAVTFFLRYLAEEVWGLPELQPIYSLQFHRMTAEATRQQVELHKTHIRETVRLSADIREALLQLTDVIAERRLLPRPEPPTLDEPPSVYYNLPQPDYGNFIGREEELAHIHQLLSPDSRHFLVTIDGIGGIGKSALALEVAHRYLRDYDRLPPEERFEAIIWTSAKASVLTADGVAPRQQITRTLEDIYTTIAVTLERGDITRARPEEQDGLVTKALTRQRTLLIVDNLETVDDERVNAFLRELPAPTKAIVTTRHRIDVAYPMRLMGMPKDDGLALIAQERAKKDVTLTDAEAQKLYDRTGGVPLAIVWSVAQMGYGYTAEVVLRRLGQPTGDIARFCFEATVESIQGQPTHKILMTLSLFASDASREALGQIADVPELDRDDALVVLEKLSLINTSGGRFHLLPLTASFVNAQLRRNSCIGKSFRLGYIRYFLKLCRRFGGEQWRLYVNLDDDLENVQLALEWAYQLKMWAEVGDFVDNLDEFLDRRGLWNDMVKYAEIAVEAGMEMNDKGLIMRQKSYGLGWIKATRLGDLEEGLASVQEAKQMALELEDEQQYAMILYDEGVINRFLGEYRKAKELLQKSLDIWRRLGNQEWAIRTIGGMGSVERMRGNLHEAFNCYTEALQRSEETGYTEHIALSLRRLGYILWHKGRLEEARGNVREALRIHERLGIVYDIAYDSLILAKIEHSLARDGEARKQAERAYEMFSRLGQQDRLKETIELLNAMRHSSSDLP